MEKQTTDCENRDMIIQCFEEDGCHTQRTICEYRHRIADCLCECGGIQKECKEAILYYMNKCWTILDISK